MSIEYAFAVVKRFCYESFDVLALSEPRKGISRYLKEHMEMDFDEFRKKLQFLVYYFIQ